jgi:hypothetical protein
MKKINKWWRTAGIAVLATLIINACERPEIEDLSPQNVATQNFLQTNSVVSTSSLPLISNSSPYTVTLESITDNGDGTWTWIWSVLNPNPGNGTNGTVQDLSHWNITLGCAQPDDIVSASKSTDGATWEVNYVPRYEVDPSQDCYTDSVYKFDLGTRNNIKTYYQLTVNKNFSVDSNVLAVYKSGRTTGCGTFNFPGFGCPIVTPDEGCSLSQGYYFAKPGLVWGTTVTIGGYTYTQAEGVAIWNTSNKGGIKDAKAGFLQVAAIKLSGSTVSPSASVWADVAIVEAYLSGLGKLSPGNLPTGNAAAKSAAGRIGDWIDLHHCED